MASIEIWTCAWQTTVTSESEAIAILGYIFITLLKAGIFTFAAYSTLLHLINVIHKTRVYKP